MKNNTNNKKFILHKQDIKNLLFQRNDLFSIQQKFLRKTFGRWLFTKFFIFFFKKKNIDRLYFQILQREYETLKIFLKKIKKNRNILSIGCGLGGLEVIMQKNLFFNSNFFLFERNFTSSKVIYGFDPNNREAYNSIKSTRLFINTNSLNKIKFHLFDVDVDKLPKIKFDIVISILSLDYHYPFDIYYKYLKKNSHASTIFVFDTVRPQYFKKVFKKIKIISKRNRIVHSSVRVICKGFI